MIFGTISFPLPCFTVSVLQVRNSILKSQFIIKSSDFKSFQSPKRLVYFRCLVLVVDGRLNVNVALERPSYQIKTFDDLSACLANDARTYGRTTQTPTAFGPTNWVGGET